MSDESLLVSHSHPRLRIFVTKPRKQEMQSPREVCAWGSAPGVGRRKFAMELLGTVAAVFTIIGAGIAALNWLKQRRPSGQRGRYDLIEDM